MQERGRSCWSVWGVLLSTFVVLTPNTVAHHCIHSSGPITLSNLHQSSKYGVQLTDKNSKMRIAVGYLGSFERIPFKEEFKAGIIGPAVKFWSEVLQVKKPLTDSLLINPFCTSGQATYTKFEGKNVAACTGSCNFGSFPKTIFSKCYKLEKDGTVKTSGIDGTGLPNTDVAVFFEYSESCSSVNAASSKIIVLDIETNRPILSLITLCASGTDFRKIDVLINIIKHELAHILAFSTSLYAFYRNADGTAKTSRDSQGLPNKGKLFPNSVYSDYLPDRNTLKFVKKVEKTSIGEISRTVALLTTSTILEVGKKYFGCLAMEGIPLEDYPDSKTGMSHLEKRLFYSNIMTATVLGDVVVTKFELALMEDSGWYIPNYSKAADADFGRNLKCSFVNLNCFEYFLDTKSRNMSAYPYCDDDLKGVCNSNKTGFVQCSSEVAPDTLSTQYKYFQDKNKYFPDPYSEYCPMYPVAGFPIELKQRFSLDCHKRYNIEHYDRLKEVFSIGPDSVCLSSDRAGRWQLKTCLGIYFAPIWGVGCYKYGCSKKDGLYFYINKEKFQCLLDDVPALIKTRTDTELLFGTIKCPICLNVCEPSICNETAILFKPIKFNSTLHCPIKQGDKISVSLFFLYYVMLCLLYIIK